MTIEEMARQIVDDVIDDGRPYDERLRDYRCTQALARRSVSTNWRATFAAVQARGPRCEQCGGWTFRPELIHLPKVMDLCPDCHPGSGIVWRGSRR